MRERNRAAPESRGVPALARSNSYVPPRRVVHSGENAGLLSRRGCHCRRRGEARVVELAISRIQIADLGIELERLEGRIGQFQFGLGNLESACVEHRQFGAGQAGAGVGHQAGHASLEILVVVVEDAEVGDDVAVEPVRLEAGLVGGHGFRLIRACSPGLLARPLNPPDLKPRATRP